MKNRILIAVLLLTISGLSYAMKPFYDENTLNQFKSKINYAKLVADLPHAQAVFVDLQAELENLRIGSQSWARMKVNSPAIVNNSQAQLSLAYENNNRQVRVDIQVFSDTGQAEIFDFMLTMIASTSKLSIDVEPVDDGPGHLYFRSARPPPDSGDRSAYLLYSNMIIKVKTVEPDIDVRDFAKAIVDVIKSHEDGQSRDYRPIELKLTEPEREVNVGEAFTIGIQASDPLNTITDVNFDELHEAFNIILNTADEIQLEALQAGSFEIQIQFVDTKTLYSGVANASVKVGPAN